MAYTRRTALAQIILQKTAQDPADTVLSRLQNTRPPTVVADTKWKGVKDTAGELLRGVAGAKWKEPVTQQQVMKDYLAQSDNADGVDRASQLLGITPADAARRVDPAYKAVLEHSTPGLPTRAAAEFGTGYGLQALHNKVINPETLKWIPGAAKKFVGASSFPLTASYYTLRNMWQGPNYGNFDQRQRAAGAFYDTGAQKYLNPAARQQLAMDTISQTLQHPIKATGDQIRATTGNIMPAGVIANETQTENMPILQRTNTSGAVTNLGRALADLIKQKMMDDPRQDLPQGSQLFSQAPAPSNGTQYSQEAEMARWRRQRQALEQATAAFPKQPVTGRSEQPIPDPNAGRQQDWEGFRQEMARRGTPVPEQGMH